MKSFSITITEAEATDARAYQTDGTSAGPDARAFQTDASLDGPDARAYQTDMLSDGPPVLPGTDIAPLAD